MDTCSQAFKIFLVHTFSNDYLKHLIIVFVIFLLHVGETIVTTFVLLWFLTEVFFMVSCFYISTIYDVAPAAFQLICVILGASIGSSLLSFSIRLHHLSCTVRWSLRHLNTTLSVFKIIVTLYFWHDLCRFQLCLLFHVFLSCYLSRLENTLNCQKAECDGQDDLNNDGRESY